MAPVTLERSIIGYGFDNGTEYQLYSEQALVPVQNPGDNSITYDISGSYYPSNISFSYELTDYVEMGLPSHMTDGGVYGPEIIIESATPLGMVSFDAS